MIDPLLVARLYSFAARADTFTAADLTSSFADEFAGDDVLGRMPRARDVDAALRFLLDEQLIERMDPGTFRIGSRVST